jgi:hypothetical protein
MDLGSNLESHLFVTNDNAPDSAREMNCELDGSSSFDNNPKVVKNSLTYFGFEGQELEQFISSILFDAVVEYDNPSAFLNLFLAFPSNGVDAGVQMYHNMLFDILNSVIDKIMGLGSRPATTVGPEFKCLNLQQILHSNLNPYLNPHLNILVFQALAQIFTSLVPLPKAQLISDRIKFHTLQMVTKTFIICSKVILSVQSATGDHYIL